MRLDNPYLREGPASTPVLQTGRDIISTGRSQIDEIQKEMDQILEGITGPEKDIVLGTETKNTRSADAANAKAQEKGFLAVLFSRGIYLIVGVIFLIIGLVMLSRPARQGITEGVREALTE